MARALGLDFGTTNTVLAMADAGARVHPVSFNRGDEVVENLRTALCFWKHGRAKAETVTVEAGPWAIAQYIDHPMDCRFLQSMKSFAASRHFQGTFIHARNYSFEDLMTAFLRRLEAYAGERLAPRPGRLVVGRPVEFVGAAPDAELAMARYDTALRRLGFEDILYVYEPVAAAFYYAQTLQRSATILVADFGGGTTDYSLIRFEVGGDRPEAQPLARGGVGIAGDTFDYRIIDNVILPAIGKGSHFKSMGRTLELPGSLFANFARWNLLSVLKTSKEFRELTRTLHLCVEPDKIQKFIDIVEYDEGYPLYKAVSDAKARLSTAEETELRFAPIGEDFSVTIRRADFETWIADDLEKMRVALDRTIAEAGLDDGAIDKVFLTGGTSFVPAIRRMFTERFGAGRIESGDELLSIANGLALIGERDDAAKWAVAT
ncbi:MAG: Hsp70 family protein [Hyphomicrobiaceae bacterium]|nr:Hsp70 family protein [Hyphomicrobiaceae bacterium]